MENQEYKDQVIQEVSEVLLWQIEHFWKDFNRDIILEAVREAVPIMKRTITANDAQRLKDNTGWKLSPLHSVTWMIFLYRVSRILYERSHISDADTVYYLNKVMHSIDWFYEIDLPIFFFAEHPLGSVLGKAKYGSHFFVYQGTTVGGSYRRGELCYPEIGNMVVLYANSSVIGNSIVGNNVIVSTNCHIVNEVVPDNCMVFGSSPNLIIKKLDKQEIIDRIAISCNWNKNTIEEV